MHPPRVPARRPRGLTDQSPRSRHLGDRTVDIGSGLPCLWVGRRRRELGSRRVQQAPPPAGVPAVTVGAPRLPCKRSLDAGDADRFGAHFAVTLRSLRGRVLSCGVDSIGPFQVVGLGGAGRCWLSSVSDPARSCRMTPIAEAPGAGRSSRRPRSRTVRGRGQHEHTGEWRFTAPDAVIQPRSAVRGLVAMPTCPIVARYRVRRANRSRSRARRTSGSL